MLFFVFFLLLFFSFLNFCVLDYIIWWSVFIICTFLFIFLVKNDVFFGCLINYYIIQEVCGYYFLVFGNWKFQFLFVLLKSGSAPFHFWLFSVLGGMKKWVIMWFLTLQKLPYFVVLVNFCGDFFFLILFFGLIFCYFQFFLMRSYSDMLVISSTESFNWLLLLSIFSLNDVCFFVFFYYFIMFLIISYSYSTSFFSFISLEMVMIFFNVPLSVTFFLKILLLFSSGFYVGFFYLILLLFMTFMSLGIGWWFFYVSMSVNTGIKYYDYFCYVLLCMTLLVYF